MEERLQKILSSCGVASRRKAEEWIAQGRVRVNGNTAKLGDTAELSQDVIEVDGVRVKKTDPPTYLMLNKPRGFVTTVSDDRGRKTVMELVADCGVRVYPVGRLDVASEGLLILTNDGAAANCLMHPSMEVCKVYLCWVSGYAEGAEARLLAPMELDGTALRTPGVQKLQTKGDTALLEITIHEGKNRQVRRMCEACGLTVTRLKRISEGALALSDLPKGSYRHLTEKEVEYIKNLQERKN